MIDVAKMTLEMDKDYDTVYNLCMSRKAVIELLISQKAKLEKEIEQCGIEKLEQGNIVLQKMSEHQRLEACKRLEDLGTYALQYALSPNYKMAIEIEEIRKKPYANVYIVKENGVKTSPTDSNGGGVIDIVSMALRLVTMQVHDPFIDGPIILDEPGKMVSKEYIPMLSQFVKNISEDFGRQVILITHNDFLAEVADKKISVKMGEGNCSIVE